MRIEVFGETYLVTDMIVIDKEPVSHMRYNVFDKQYRHVTTIDAEDDEDFLKIFKKYLLTNKK